MRPGALVVWAPVDPDDIVPGDIVAFQIESGKPTVATHRVTEIVWATSGERLFTTWGDALEAPDREPVREAQIRGRVLYALPPELGVGYLNNLIGNAPWLRTAAAGLLGVIGAWNLGDAGADAWRERRRRGL